MLLYPGELYRLLGASSYFSLYSLIIVYIAGNHIRCISTSIKSFDRKERKSGTTNSRLTTEWNDEYKVTPADDLLTLNRSK